MELVTLCIYQNVLVHHSCTVVKMFWGYDKGIASAIIIYVNKSCCCFTASSFYFSWKMQWIECIDVYVETHFSSEPMLAKSAEWQLTSYCRKSQPLLTSYSITWSFTWSQLKCTCDISMKDKFLIEHPCLVLEQHYYQAIIRSTQFNY